MTSEELLRGFFLMIIALVICWRVYDSGQEAGPPDGKRRFSTLVNPFLLPVLMLALLILTVVKSGFSAAFDFIVWSGTVFFGLISVYYLILRAVLPFLRKKLSASACSLMWLIPNLLYMTGYAYMNLSRPRLVIRADRRFLMTALAVWLCGFAAVLGWKIIGHLSLRHRLLKNAEPLVNADALRIWQKLQEEMGEPKRFGLFGSPDIESAVSVGVFRGSVRVLIPKKDYTAEELSLILRHELIHVMKSDGAAKFFLSFCTAACWFNPLMWMAMRRSAEDIELSCDEAVLENADEQTRKLYAGLILSSAGEDGGFTSCLSAGAKSLRYRLRRILKPGKRLTGGFCVGLAFFITAYCCGFAALAYDPMPGELPAPELEGCLCDVMYNNGGWSSCYGADAEALCEYVSKLEPLHISGSYTFSDADSGGKGLMLSFTKNGKLVCSFIINDYTLSISDFGDRRDYTRWYLAEKPDWDYIYSAVMGAG